MRVLLIDNNIMLPYWGAQDLARYQSLFPGSLWHVRRAPQRDLPRSLSHIDKVIVSGSLTSILEQSDWITDLENFVRKTVEESKPFLGICFGHQILARALFGYKSVRRAARSEFGWTAIRKLAENSLLEGLPTQFYSYSAHYDEVHCLPDHCRVLAESADCPIQAFEVRYKPAFGIQFHPEKTPLEAKETFLERKRKGLDKDYLNAHRDRTLYDPSIGERIFRNFMQL